MSKNYNFGWSNQVPVQIHVLFEFELFLFLSAVKRFQHYQLMKYFQEKYKKSSIKSTMPKL